MVNWWIWLFGRCLYSIGFSLGTISSLNKKPINGNNHWDSYLSAMSLTSWRTYSPSILLLFSCWVFVLKVPLHIFTDQCRNLHGFLPFEMITRLYEMLGGQTVLLRNFYGFYSKLKVSALTLVLSSYISSLGPHVSWVPVFLLWWFWRKFPRVIYVFLLHVKYSTCPFMKEVQGL